MAKRPLLLCILDGFGWVPQETYGNAIAAAKTPDFDKLFAFRLPEEGLWEVARASEAYVLNTLGRSFPTLDFYHQAEPGGRAASAEGTQTEKLDKG